METRDIKINKSIVHVLNSEKKDLALSYKPIQYSLDFQEYLKKHIIRILESDDSKICEFRDNSEVKKIIKNENSFVFMSQNIAKELFHHMNQHEGIPSADLIIMQIEVKGSQWLALLKMNYISTYTHKTEGEVNQVIVHSNVFPKSGTTKLKESALINLENYSLRVLEKKFEVDGIKANYYSGLFLKCRGEISAKTKIRIVKNTLDSIRDKYLLDGAVKAENSIESKSTIAAQYDEEGIIDTSKLVEILFKDNEEAKNELIEKLSKYNLDNTKIAVKNDETVEKISKHKIVTNTGIELIIPMKNSNNKNILFQTEPNGNMTIVIKNITTVKNN